MTLPFLTTLWLAGFLVWVTSRRWPWLEHEAALPMAVLAGLGAGFFLSAWA